MDIRRIQVKLEGDVEIEDGLVLPPRLKVLCRIWNDQTQLPESEWIPVPCTSIRVEAGVNGVVEATVSVRPAKLENIVAGLTGIEPEFIEFDREDVLRMLQQKRAAL